MSSKKAAIYDGCNANRRLPWIPMALILKEGSHLRRLQLPLYRTSSTTLFPPRTASGAWFRLGASVFPCQCSPAAPARVLVGHGRNHGQRGVAGIMGLTDLSLTQ